MKHDPSQNGAPPRPIALGFISNSGAPHSWILEALHASHPSVGVIRPIWGAPAPAPSSDRWQRFKSHPIKTVLDRAGGMYADRRIQRLEAEVCEKLYGSPAHAITALRLIDVPQQSLNSNDTGRLLRGLDPDVVVVSGAPILKKKIFTIPRLGCLNVHFGIAPRYRGEHTLFFPLLRGDSGQVGLTIHHINEGIDRGRIIARIYPWCERGDTEAALWARCAKLAVPILREILDYTAANGRLPEGMEQSAPPAELIRYRDRKLRHDMAFTIRRFLKLTAVQEERTERFYDPVPVEFAAMY
jgi:folate-dependent phosphoribosylglycinamide formyltransferase PurN